MNPSDSPQMSTKCPQVETEMSRRGFVLRYTLRLSTTDQSSISSKSFHQNYHGYSRLLSECGSNLLLTELQVHICCFQSYIQGRRQTISKLFPRRERPIISANSASLPRTKLLIRLQNNRWRYCNQCWTLHPHSAWRALRSNWKLYQQPCNSGCSLVGAQSQKCSFLYAGEVLVCPCQAITFHQSQDIAEYCRGSSLGLGLDHSSFKITTSRNGRRKISHKCSVTTKSANIEVTTGIRVCDRSNGLRIWNDFTLIVFDPSP